MRRMTSAAVCQPLAISPLKRVRAAASGSSVHGLRIVGSGEGEALGLGHFDGARRKHGRRRNIFEEMSGSRQVIT